MAGSSSTGDEKSMRKRFAASIKRVMSLNKSGRAGSSTKDTPVPGSPTTPTALTSAQTPAPIGYVAATIGVWGACQICPYHVLSNAE